MRGRLIAALVLLATAASGQQPQQPQPYPYPYPYPPYPYPYPYPYAYPPPPEPPKPREMPYEEGDPVPPGYHLESRVRRGPIIAGSIMAGTTYGINLLIAAAVDDTGDDDDNVGWLYVPGVGTWAYADDACDGDGDDDDGCTLVVLHSLTHTMGIALIIYGIAAPRQRLVRDDASVRVVPLVSRSTSGIGLTGYW